MRTEHLNDALTRHRWWLADVVVVLAFVLIGRESHDEGNALVEVARTAAPFLVGLVAAWLMTGGWRVPLDPRTGVVVAAVTVTVGLTVRRIVFGDGTAMPFIIVTTLVLGAGLLGWRLVVGLVMDRSRGADRL